MSELKLIVMSIMGVTGSFVASFFGGWDTAIETLFIFMTIDYMTGFLLAVVFKKSQKTETGAGSSKVGFVGLVKKGVILAIVMVAYRVDLTLGADFVRIGTVIAFIVNEVISITENAGLMGIPIPSAIKNGLDILKKRGETHETT